MVHIINAHTDRISYSGDTVYTLCRSGNLMFPQAGEELCVDWSAAGFLSITQIVGLTQVMSSALSYDMELSMECPSGNVEHYMQRMNVYRLLGLPVKESFRRHDPAGNFIPLVRVDSQDVPAQVSNKIKDMVIAHVGNGDWSPGGAMDVSFSEIMDNIICHSESPSYGVVGAQYYSQHKVIELCVADGGKGIVASMSENPMYRGCSAEWMMECALKEGYGQYVGMPAFVNERTSGGKGLTYPTRLTQALGGKMWVISHQYALEVSQAGIRQIGGLFYPGTLISLRLPVREDAVVLSSQIFDNGMDVPITWSAAEGWTDLQGDQVDSRYGGSNPLW